MTPTEVVQGQLDAYNAQDLDRFCAFYAPDCVVADLNGAITQQGRDAIRSRYSALFAEHPHNRAALVNRISLGQVVIDHEDVTRAPGIRFEVIAIYTVANGQIVRVDFARKAG
jgi:uncharacterized protein (TIGR02246 family)